MKKSLKIVLFIALIVVTASLLVACGNTDANVDGYYYSVDEDKNTVEVLKVEGDRFTLYTIVDETVSSNDLLAVIKSDVETAITKEGVTKSSGSCSYTDNSFVESRLDLKFDENDKTSTYAYLKDDTFAFSPKFGTVCLYALIGFCITLIVLCVLMGIIKLLGFSVEKVTAKAESKKSKKEESIEKADSSVVLAKGSAGDIRLENVSERDAAMIMAIVADQTGEPLNTLRFISIKDVTEENEKE